MFILGLIILLVGGAGSAYFMFKAQSATTSKGEQSRIVAAQAAYQKLKRENPNHPDAQLSEPEYVQAHAGKGPSALLNWLFGILCFLVLVIPGCFMTVFSA